MLRWLRELASWCQEQQLPMHLRYELEGAIAVLEDAMGQARRHQSDGGARGVKRKEANVVRTARMRLLDLWDEEEDDINQHQLYEDLKTVQQLIQAGLDQYVQATLNQGGNSLQQGATGLQQAASAVQHATSATVQGDLDWFGGSWGAAVAVLMEDAEQVLEDAMDAQYVHSADVIGLCQGGDEPPRRPQGAAERLETILGDIRQSLGFLTAGQHAQVLNVLAMMAMWQSQEGAYTVDTQTTNAEDAATEGKQQGPTGWLPQQGVTQWQGSLPSSTDDAADDRNTEDAGGPTEEDLLRAMEEYEQQAAEDHARSAEAASLFTRRRTEPEGEHSRSHRRRRMHSAFDGDP